MVKFIVVLYRKPGWETQAFRSYLADVHGVMAEKMPGLLRYVHNYTADDATRRHPGWDAIIELSWADRESMEASWDSPEGLAATADLDAFVDLERTRWSIVEEFVRRK
jgi:uncharacterized protein (TIGR02118 family)